MVVVCCNGELIRKLVIFLKVVLHEKKVELAKVSGGESVKSQVTQTVIIHSAKLNVFSRFLLHFAAHTHSKTLRQNKGKNKNGDK